SNLLLQDSSLAINDLKREYYQIEKRKRWAEARSYCTTYYTDIVSIRSTEENMYVTQLFSKDTPLWLGLYNNNRTTTMWEWINGDDFIYTHWKNKEPNAPLGSVICVAMRNDQWFDNYCNQTYRFACYKGYHLIDQRKSWSEARDYCRKQHTDLVSIRNSEEQKVFTSMFVRDVALWIGLYNNNRSETGWKWINGDKVNYTHWKEKEPNGYRGAMICVAVRNALPLTTIPANRDYYWIDQRKNWIEARDYCRSHYMDLISIQSAEEQKTISKMFDGDEPIWIGLYNSNHTTAGWKWINEDKFSYAHWKDNGLSVHPDSEICVAMNSGVWFNVNCNQTYWFACYQGKIRE
uniref:C-type lectin domain-containing protein n=1 Tax=Callorhinchus milii TaxID=7868 RepID=A0A4W3HMY0_CALMI